MRKDSFKIVIITAVAGVFGMFLRWLQNLNAFEVETGLAVEGAVTTTIMLVYLVVALVLFAVLTWYLLRQFEASKQVAQALKSENKLPALFSRAGAVLLAAAGVAMMFTAHDQPHPLLTRVLAACVIVLAASVPFLTLPTEEEKNGGNPLALLGTIFCCVWLVCIYRDHAEDPVLWAFVVEVLAVVANTLSCYELGAYFYGRAKPARALFFAQTAAFLNLCTLTDERSTAAQVLFVVFASGMLLLEYLLLANLQHKADK